MRATVFTSAVFKFAALPALALAGPAFAQDASALPSVDPDYAYGEEIPYAAGGYEDETVHDRESDEGIADMAARMGDPARQRETALMLQTMAEIVLDLPIAPLAEAIGQAAGRAPGSIDPDLTLRRALPGSSDLPERIAEAVPRAMGTAGGIAAGVERMLPAFEQMAEEIERALPPAR